MRTWHSFNLLIVHRMKYYMRPFLWCVLILFMLSGYGNPYIMMDGGSLVIEEEVFQLIEAEAGDVSEALRIMTYNIRHARGMDGAVDLNRIAGVISSVEADIVLLQEVDRYHIRSHWADQIKMLGEQLNMAWAYAPTLQWGWSQYGNAMLSRFPIESIDILTMPSTREARNVMLAQVTFDSQPLYIFNTHLGLDATERGEQLRLFREWVQQMDIGGYRSVFAGDMNMEKDDPLIREHEQYWYRLQMEGPTFYTGEQIDHLFTNHVVKLDHIEIVKTNASDHYPVWAEVRWPDSSLIR